MEKKNKPAIRFKGFDEEWKEESVGTYYDFKNGLNKGKEFFGYGKPIVNFTDVFHKRGLLPNHLNGKVDVTADEIRNYSVQKGDIFFTRTSETIEEIGQPSVMLDEPTQAVFSGFVLRARAFDEDPLEIGFKQYAFFTHSFRTEMVKKSSMTTRALTSGTAIKKMLFTFPTKKEEQQQIGNFFENLDKLITQHQQKHSKLQALKKAMLGKMFPKQGQTVPEIRFKGFEGDWVEKKLESEIDFFTGLTYSPLDVVKDEGTFVIRSSNIKEGKLVSADNVYVKTSRVNCEFVKENDIAVVVRNGSRDLIGKHAQIKSTFDNTVIGAFMTGIRSEQANFINALLDTKHFKDEINKNLGATINQITTGNFKSMKFWFPRKEEQKLIGNYFNNLDELISNHETQITKLQNIKKALLAKMFV